MDSTEDVLSKQPWGETYYERRWGFHLCRYPGGGDPHKSKWNVEIDAQFRLVQDHPRSYWERGDIVIFGVGYHNLKPNWREWFIGKEKYLEYLKLTQKHRRNKQIPLYARLEYGLLLSRYKWIKQKDMGVFRDYGSIVMMLTGKRAGHIRRYYPAAPFEKISKYPYQYVIPFYARIYGKHIPEQKRIREAMKNANKDKDQFILNMIESYQE